MLSTISSTETLSACSIETDDGKLLVAPITSSSSSAAVAMEE
ncbi:hypothetical protein ACGFNP_07915 [Nonomuraea sp. NPDC049269]